MKRVICGDEVQEVLEIWVKKIWTSEAAVNSDKGVFLGILRNF